MNPQHCLPSVPSWDLDDTLVVEGKTYVPLLELRMSRMVVRFDAYGAKIGIPATPEPAGDELIERVPEKVGV